MSRRASIVAALIGINTFCFGALIEPSVGQDAQAEATAKATKRQAAEDTARSSLDVAKPTDVGAPPTTGAAAPDSDTLKRRAGEQGGDSARGRTLILGMHVKEAADGGVEVGEVGLATPAQEAGIRKGDKIISFQNFKADSYRKWIDGIRRLATGAGDGSMITIVVLRDGNLVTTKVRIPDNQIGPIKLPLGPQPGQPQATQASGNEINNIGGNGGNAVALGDSGAMANFFSEAPQPGSEKGFAELFRTVRSDKVSDPNRSVGNNETSPSDNTDLPRSGSTRVGLAGFRNDANGMLVMVDVGGLDPGNYTVCIADASALGNQAQSIGEPTSNARPPVNNSLPGTNAAPGSAGNSNPSGLIPNSNRAPLETPATATPPQSRIESPGREIPGTVLAQVAGNKVTDGTASTTGSPQPSAAPGAALAKGVGAQGAGSVGDDNTTTAPLNQNTVGTLTIDQSGTGRMQQLVEGVRVRSFVGQALVIYAATASPSVTLPPNLDAAADPGSPKPPANSGSPSLPPPSAPSASHPEPVVGGVIRLLSDRGNDGTEQGTNQPATVPTERK